MTCGPVIRKDRRKEIFQDFVKNNYADANGSC